jgi:glycosyltransferase 2 family protein
VSDHRDSGRPRPGSRPAPVSVPALDQPRTGTPDVTGRSGVPFCVIGIYALVNLAALNTTVLSFLITLLTGCAIGLGVRYAAGSMPARPTAEEIARALLRASRWNDMCVRAFGGSAPIASVAVVYLTGSALGSLVPTPGGLGAVEAALSAGLTAAGLPGAAAVSSVLLFRLLTFWLPVPAGWAALKYLERRQAL